MRYLGQVEGQVEGQIEGQVRRSVFSTSDSASYRVCPKNTPWPRCPRQETLSSCATVFDSLLLHTMNHSVYVNWNYRS